MEPPERLALRDIVLRRWSEDDLLLLHDAIGESHEHLQAWMPWAAERQTLGQRREFLATSGRAWRTGESYAYGIFDPAESQILGSVALHDSVGAGSWEIGYWVHAAHTRRGLATAAAATLTRVAFSLPGTERVEIHCDEANIASAAVPRGLGYRLDRVQIHPPSAPAESGKRLIWVIDRVGFFGSRAEQTARTAMADREGMTTWRTV